MASIPTLPATMRPSFFECLTAPSRAHSPLCEPSFDGLLLLESPRTKTARNKINYSDTSKIYPPIIPRSTEIRFFDGHESYMVRPQASRKQEEMIFRRPGESCAVWRRRRRG